MSVRASPHIQAKASEQSTWLGRHKKVALVLGSYGLSLLGDSFHLLAISIWVLETTGSAKIMSLLYSAQILCSLLFGSIAGTAADRLDRRKLMIGMDILRAVVVLLLLVVLGQDQYVFPLLVFLSMVLAFTSLFHSPALHASLSQLVQREQLERTTASISMIENSCRILGAALGGILITLAGLEVAILFNLVTFVVSALLVIAAGRFSEVGQRVVPKTQSFWQDMRDGIQLIFVNPDVRMLVMLIPLISFFFMPAFILIQVMAKTVWMVSNIEFGIIEAGIPLGYFMGATFLLGYTERIKHRGWIIATGILLLGPILLAMAFADTSVARIVLVIFLGLVFAMCTLMTNVLIRFSVHESKQGRVFGSLGAFANITPLVGMTLGSISADHFGPQPVLMTIGLLTTFALTVVILANPRIKNFK